MLTYCCQLYRLIMGLIAGNGVGRLGSVLWRWCIPRFGLQ